MQILVKDLDWKTFARCHPEHGADWLGQVRLGDLPEAKTITFAIAKDGTSFAYHEEGQSWIHRPHSIVWERQ